MAEISERTAAISKQAAIFKASQHDLVRSVLTANDIPCPADPDAFAKILKKLPPRACWRHLTVRRCRLQECFQAITQGVDFAAGQEPASYRSKFRVDTLGRDVREV